MRARRGVLAMTVAFFDHEHQVRYISRLRVSDDEQPSGNWYLDSVARADSTLESVKHLVKLVIREECQILNIKQHPLRSQLRATVLRFPAMFTLLVDEAGEPWIDLTPDMEQLHRDELQVIKSRDGPASVDVLRKLLMMSRNENQLPISKLYAVRKEFMLPDDFHTGLVTRYPEFFSVVAGTRGPLLKLASWDISLAETSREKNHLWHPGTPESSFFLVDVDESELSKDYVKFQKLFFPSPYEPVPRSRTTTSTSSMVLEKRIVATFHELLSLMPAKRCPVQVLKVFNPEFGLPLLTHSLLVRHPGIFYFSNAVDPPKVFLREAFGTNKLKYKGPEDLIRDRYLDLMIKSGKLKSRVVKVTGEQQWSKRDHFLHS